MRAVVMTLLGMILLVIEVPAQATRRVSDPYQSENFSCMGKPDGRLFNNLNEKRGYNGFRMRADLNFDGREDLILSSSDDVGCASSGCAVAIFLKQTDNAYISLDFWLHPLATALTMVRPRQGQLVTYQRSSAQEGVIAFDRITSDSLTRTEMRTVHVNDSPSDAALYQSWFSGKMALRAEYASCANGRLAWTDTYQ